MIMLFPVSVYIQKQFDIKGLAIAVKNTLENSQPYFVTPAKPKETIRLAQPSRKPTTKCSFSKSRLMC